MGNEETITPWQRRAQVAGFHVWNNKRVSDMTDEEIEAAFDAFSEVSGIHYIPRKPRYAQKSPRLG